MKYVAKFESANKKNFYKKFFYLSIPLVFQQIVQISLNTVDSLMIGHLGSEAIAGVSFASKLSFIFFLFLYGAGNGAGILISHYYGNNQITIVRKIFALIVIVFLILGAAFTAVGLGFAKQLIQVFTKEANVITLGSDYLYITSFSFILMGFSFAVALTMRYISLTKQVLYVTLVMTLVNTLLNYLLIYGNFGFPILGVKGAAIATLIARFVEFIMFVALILKYNYGLKAKLKEYFGLSKEVISSILKLTIPIFLNEAIWVSATTLLAIAYATLGTEASAAIAISDVMLSIGSIIFVASTTGSSILIAQALGANQLELAKWMATRIIYISLFFAVISSIVSLLAIHPFLSFYTLSEQTKHITILVLVVIAFVTFFKRMNMCLLVGIIRAGGDVRVTVLIDVGILVFYAVPIAFVSAIYWQLPIYYVLLLANLEEVFKLILATWRYKTKKWVKRLVTT